MMVRQMSTVRLCASITLVSVTFALLSELACTVKFSPRSSIFHSPSGPNWPTRSNLS
jgi:hypothetical protein